MKSKKKLLIAMAAMSVAAIGAGTVSTFAWFKATSSATISSTHTEDDTVTVAHTQLGISGVKIGLKIVASDANQSKLLYAHYNNATNAANPKLSTGYLDPNGGWHDLGYQGTDVDENREPNLGTYPGTSILHSTLSIKVEIDYDYTEDGAAWNGGHTEFTDANSNVYTSSQVEDMVAAAYIKLGITTDSNARIRFYETAPAAAETTSNWYSDIAAGNRYTVSDTTYVKIVDNHLLSGFTLASGKTLGTLNYYVWGGEDDETPTNDEGAVVAGVVTYNPSFDLQASSAGA